MSWKVQQLITVDAGRMQELADIGINAQRSRFYPSGCGGRKNSGNAATFSEFLGGRKNLAPNACSGRETQVISALAVSGEGGEGGRKTLARALNYYAF